MPDLKTVFEKEYGLKDVENIAQSLLQSFPDSKIWTFTGELGSGKTTLIRSLCGHLRYNEDVSSPTFAIVNEYASADVTIYHMDLYRIKNEDELLQLGFEDYLYSGHFCFIEWPQIAQSFFDEIAIHLFLEAPEENKRQIRACVPASS